MRVVVQRVSEARVRVEGQEIGRIGRGLLVFLGVMRADERTDADWLIARLIRLRVFEETAGRMEQSVVEIAGEVMVISQFTLFGSLRKGSRPSFNRAADSEEASALYDYLVSELSVALGKPVPTGRFGAHMEIDVQNDGPVTLILDSRNRE